MHVIAEISAHQLPRVPQPRLFKSFLSRYYSLVRLVSILSVPLIALVATGTYTLCNKIPFEIWAAYF